jgi:hypothetical protein
MTKLIEDLRHAGFQYSANALYDQAADRLEKLERVARAAADYLWGKGDAVIEELEAATEAADDGSLPETSKEPG